MHSLKTIQRFPISLDEAWDFFSSPANLKDITPEHMGFKILSENEGKMYPGMIISYNLKPFPHIPVKWVTEITHVEEKKYFVDYQIHGPYSIWHHQHHFREIEGGTEMRDILHYRVPFGILGKAVNTAFIAKKVRQIFEYRYQILEKKFGKLE
jgi:ligand-binding SRPBCC domain-containing protein